jgi:hypothetical protein
VIAVRRLLSAIVFSFLCAGAAAQQRPVFDPDDFLEPRRLGDRAAFFSRLVVGGALNFIDDYRPTGKDAGFVHVTNSLYWKRLQFDYKRTEISGGDRPPVQLCACQPPVFFPTPPPPDAIPAPPPPGPKNTLQFGVYYPVPNGLGAGPPVMLRSRVTWTQQTIRTDVASAATGKVVSRLSGGEQSFGLDSDLYARIRGRALFGSLRIARTTRSGTADDREQTEVTYSHRFPGFSYKRVLFRTIVTVGSVSGRDGTAINVLNPYFEAFLHERRTRANFHLVYSPQSLNSGAEGWKTHHQIALFADRALFIHLFR